VILLALALLDLVLAVGVGLALFVLVLAVGVGLVLFVLVLAPKDTNQQLYY
jgi:hypothetical protein